MNQKRSVKLGRIQGVEIRIKPSAVISAIMIATSFSFMLFKVLKWRPWTAVSGGIIVSLIHYLSELWHQFGHARAAEQTGFPMQGVTLMGPVPIGVSVYPDNEGLLPAEMHIQRALGGPIFSLLLTLASGLLALLFRPLGGLPLVLAVFTFLDNLLIYTIGALLPLGFTDGSTIVTWWDQRQGNGRVRIG
jgi:hypothetical protein